MDTLESIDIDITLDKLALKCLKLNKRVMAMQEYITTLENREKELAELSKKILEEKNQLSYKNHNLVEENLSLKNKKNEKNSTER